MRPQPHARPSTPTAPRGARTRRGRRVARPWGTAVALVLSLTAASPAAAGPAEPGSRVVSVAGTVQHVVIDGAPEGPGDHHDAMVLDTMVKVDGALYDLPDADTEGRPGSAGGPAEGELVSGDPVVVTVRADRDLSATEALTEATDGSPTGPQVVGVTPAPAAPRAAVLAPVTVLGAHTLTVLPVQFGSGALPPAKASLTAVATAAAGYWSEQSAGRVTFAPSVRDTRRVVDPGSCDPTTIMRLALQAHGVPAASGNHHVAVYFPARTDCGGWAGMGAVRGGDIWINGLNTVDVMAHEIGHNLGIGHANLATCRESGVRVSLSADCTNQPYGDLADVMGYASHMAPGTLNSALADQLGLARVHDVSDLPVTLDIARLSDAGQVRSLRIPTPHGTVYVDFRPAQGRDVRQPGWAGVQVHRLSEGSYPESQLLDLQPTTARSFTAPALPTGESWVIPGTGRQLTVRATDATHATLALSDADAPAEDLTFVPVTPTRLLDTRTTATPLTAGVVRDLVVAGRNGIPSDARAVAINLTAVHATATTHLRAWPSGGAPPSSSVLNTDPDRVAATGVMLGVGTGRAVSIRNEVGTVHVIADVTGYYVASGGHGFEPLTSPVRLLDTRTGQGGAPGPVPDRGTRTVAVAGRHGVPADATAVLVNVTSVGTSGGGHLATYPAGSAHPGTSTVNHVPGTASTNRAAVKLGGGALTVEVGGAGAEVLVDLVGWFGPTGRQSFTPIAPVRAFDTRRVGGALGAGASRDFDVRTASGIAGSAGGTAVMVLTATGGTAPETFATVWQGTTARPQTSDLNVRASTDQANLVVAPWSAAGTVRVYNNLGQVNVVGDIYGYFS